MPQIIEFPLAADLELDADIGERRLVRSRSASLVDAPAPDEVEIVQHLIKRRRLHSQSVCDADAAAAALALAVAAASASASDAAAASTSDATAASASDAATAVITSSISAADADIRIDVLLRELDWAAHLKDKTRAGLLDAEQPHTPPVWFYDDAGSQLFCDIMRVPEYYPARAEAEILRAHCDEIARLTSTSVLIDLGSGSSEKTRLLIAAMRAHGSLRVFAPMDCAHSTLLDAARTIVAEHPGLRVHGVVGDFTKHLSALPTAPAPSSSSSAGRLLAFLGCTIGNFSRAERADFLRQVAATLATGEWFLVGTDLVKDVRRLEAAYDDAQGVTAAFNLNALSVMNRDLGADFVAANFRHTSHWSAEHARVEMRLHARGDQHVRFPALGDDVHVTIKDGAFIRTEMCYKFTRAQVVDELAAVGLRTVRQFTDAAGDMLVTLAQRQ